MRILDAGGRVNLCVEATGRRDAEVGQLHAQKVGDIVRRLSAVDKRTAIWCAALAAAVVVLIAVPLANALNIWLDEAFTLHTTAAGVGTAWSQAVSFEDQPPLYFIIEAGWRMWNEASFTFARLPSIIFAAGAVAAIVGTAHRIAPRTPPLVVAALAAFHPVIISAAVEMRAYALVFLIGTLLTWTFVEAFLVARPSRNARICYTIVALAGLYAQYFVGFVLVAHALTLIVLQRRSIPAFIGFMSIVTVGFVPLIRVAVVQVHSTGDSVVHATFISSVHRVAGALFVYALPHDFAWNDTTRIVGFVAAAALIGTIVAVGRPQALPREALGVVLQLGIAFAVFSLTFAAVGLPVDLVRHLAVLAPATLLCVCVLLSSLRRIRLLACAATVMVFAVFAASALWGQYHPPLAKPGDWQRVAALARTGDPKTPIAVFPAELALPLRLYLPVAAVAIPRPMPFVLEYVAATTLTGESEVARVLDPLQARSARLRLVTENRCRPRDLIVYSYNCAYLEAFMRRHYRLDQTVLFRGLVVRRYSRLSTPHVDRTFTPPAPGVRPTPVGIGQPNL